MQNQFYLTQKLPPYIFAAMYKLKTEASARALKCFEVVEYALEEMKKLGIKAWKNPNAITIIFPKPAEEICVKWQLASDGELSHIICMPGVTKEKIDEFLLHLSTKI